MEDPNVERVKQGYAALAAGDIEGVLSLLDPNIVVHERTDLPDAGIVHGPQGLAMVLTRDQEVWSDPRYEPIHDVASGEWVVVEIRFRAHSSEGNVPIGDNPAHAWRIRNGKAIEARFFPSWREAVEALGIKA